MTLVVSVVLRQVMMIYRSRRELDLCKAEEIIKGQLECIYKDYIEAGAALTLYETMGRDKDKGEILMALVNIYTNALVAICNVFTDEEIQNAGSCLKKNKGEHIENIINMLDKEVERHKAQENEETTTWGRGFENGSMTEAMLLKSKIREIMKCGH